MSVEKSSQHTLTYAAWNGHTSTVTLLLDCGANIDHQDMWGKTALMGAALNGHSSTVRLLLERGANVDMENRVDIVCCVMV